MNEQVGQVVALQQHYVTVLSTIVDEATTVDSWSRNKHHKHVHHQSGNGGSGDVDTQGNDKVRSC